MSNAYTPTVQAPIVSIAAWNKNDRRAGINPNTNEEFNDPHLNMKVQLNTVKLAKIVADALASGKVSVEIVGGLWCNATDTENQPAITGNANTTRADIEARKIAAANAQAQTALSHADNMKEAVSA